ncbi:hypothetical protein LCGC14_3047490 [marine sediment metagenome]|uniref:Uncharacterized protein n=1 Tax=marine sediment metagenome TaxID=412755 RepID=A0A0F8WN54_9ZZZZ
MVRQGYKDARRKRFKVGGSVPHVWKEGDTVTASYPNRHAADVLGQQIMTDTMRPGARARIEEDLEFHPFLEMR